MSLNQQVFEKIRIILHEKFHYSYEDIEPQIYFEKELAVDSKEMHELIAEFESTFDIIINYDEMDKFYFQSQIIKHVDEIKQISIQDSVNYIEKKIRSKDAGK
jgi:acyl carrier protein